VITRRKLLKLSPLVPLAGVVAALDGDKLTTADGAAAKAVELKSGKTYLIQLVPDHYAPLPENVVKHLQPAMKRLEQILNMRDIKATVVAGNFDIYELEAEVKK